MKKVVCLMPTCGRFRLAQRAISFFLEQTYKNKELVVFNQGQIPMVGDFPDVKIVNSDKSYSGLNEIYSDALQHCDGDLINMWDDDDGRFPWFLEDTINAKEKKSAKTEQSFVWSEGMLRLHGNIVESSIVVDIDVIRDQGFGDRKIFVHMKWFNWLKDHGELQYIFTSLPGFVYCWGEPDLCTFHSSCTTDEDASFAGFHKASVDFGDGNLKRVDVKPWWYHVSASHPELRTKLGFPDVILA